MESECCMPCCPASSIAKHAGDARVAPNFNPRVTRPAMPAVSQRAAGAARALSRAGQLARSERRGRLRGGWPGLQGLRPAVDPKVPGPQQFFFLFFSKLEKKFSGAPGTFHSKTLQRLQGLQEIRGRGGEHVPPPPAHARGPIRPCPLPPAPSCPLRAPPAPARPCPAPMPAARSHAPARAPERAPPALDSPRAPQPSDRTAAAARCWPG